MSRLGESRRVFFTHTRRHCVVTCLVRRLKSSSPSACEVPFLAPSTRVSRRPRGRASPQRLAGHAHVSLCDGPARASRSLRRGLITCCCAHHRPWSPRVTAQADDCGAGARERKGHRRRDAGCSRRPAPLRPLPAASAPTPGPAQLPPAPPALRRSAPLPPVQTAARAGPRRVRTRPCHDGVARRVRRSCMGLRVRVRVAVWHPSFARFRCAFLPRSVSSHPPRPFGVWPL